MRYLKYLFVLVVVFTLNSHYLYSQTPSATITMEYESTEDVPLRPLITLKTNMVIDTSTFIIEAMEFIPPDSISIISPTGSTLGLYRKKFFDEYPDTMRNLFSIGGEYAFINDTTITFNCVNNLNYKNEYIVYLNGLKVLYDGINPYPDTLTVSNISVTFTTVDVVNHLVNSIFDDDGHLLNCNDSIYFDFYKAIDFEYPVLDSLIIFNKIVGDTIISNQLIWLQEQISFSTSLNEQNNRIYIIPENDLDPGMEYFLNFNFSGFTGNKKDDWMNRFKVKDAAKITMGIDYDNPPDPLPSELWYTSLNAESTYLFYGDTLTVIAEESFSGKKFDKWLCPQDNYINNNTSRTISISQECADVKNLDITAFFTDFPYDTVIVGSIESGTISVYNTIGTYIGSSGTYTVPRNDIDLIKVVVEPSDGYFLDHWVSNSSFYNNLTGNELIYQTWDWIHTGGGISLDPFMEPWDGKYRLTIYILWENHWAHWSENHDIKDWLTTSPSVADGNGGIHTRYKEFVYDNNNTVNVSATITSGECDCYRISKVIKAGNTEFSSSWCDLPCSTSWSGSVTPTRTGVSVSIYAHPKLHEVEAELVVKDGGELLPTSYFYPSVKILGAQLIPEHYMTSCSFGINHLGYKYYFGRDNFKEYYKLRYKCHFPVKFDVDIGTHKEFYEFERWDNVGYYAVLPYTIPSVNLLGDCGHFKGEFTKDIGNSIKAILDPTFRLVKVDFQTTPNSSEYTSYPFSREGFIPLQPIDDDIFKTININGDPHTATFKLYFTEDVDKTTITSSNLQILGKLKRIDYYDEQYDEFNPAPMIWDPTNISWIDDKTMEWTIEVPRGQELQIKATNGIKNTESETLKNPNDLTFHTVLPYIYLNLQNWEVTYQNAKLFAYVLFGIDSPLEDAEHASAVKKPQGACNVDNGLYNWLLVNDQLSTINDIFGFGYQVIHMNSIIKVPSYEPPFWKWYCDGANLSVNNNCETLLGEFHDYNIENLNYDMSEKILEFCNSGSIGDTPIWFEDPRFWQAHQGSAGLNKFRTSRDYNPQYYEEVFQGLYNNVPVSLYVKWTLSMY